MSCPISLPQFSFGQKYFNAIVSAVQKNVEYLAKSPKGETFELEFRLGIPLWNEHRVLGNGQTIQGFWGFNAGVDIGLFNHLIEGLNKKYKGVEELSTVNSKGIREYQFRKIEVDGGGIKYLKKQKVSHIDLPFISGKFPSSDFPKESRKNVHILRLSSSIETISSQKEYDTINENTDVSMFVRKRRRISYNLENIATLDLTIVDDTFEVELEYNQSFIKGIDKNKLRSCTEFLRDTKFLLPLKILFNELFGQLSNYVGLGDISERYSDLLELSWGGERKSDVRPKNIGQSDIPKLRSTPYSVTNKFDGKAYRLLITSILGGNSSSPKSVMFMVNNTDIQYIADTPPSLLPYNETLLDVERDENGVQEEYHIFDALVVGNKSVTMGSHIDPDNPRRGRIYAVAGLTKLLQEYFIQQKLPVVIDVKNFTFTNNLHNDILSTMRYMYEKFGDKVSEKNDGLIFTPVGSYSDRDTGKTKSKTYYGRGFPILKWKYPSKVTIDFMLTNLNDKTTIFRNGLEQPADVYSVSTTDEDRSLKVFTKYSIVGEKYPRIYYPPSIIYITKDDYEMLDMNNLDKKIVEVGYDKNSNEFIPHRLRGEKKFPNAKKVAELTFLDMFDVFSLKKLIDYISSEGRKGEEEQKGEEKKGLESDSLRLFRTFSNNVVRNLVQTYCGGKQVLDLGAGKGGSLPKYKEVKIKYLWAVEPDPEHIKEFNERLDKSYLALKERVSLIEAKAEETQKITDVMTNRPAGLQRSDVVVCFFSFTFFTKNRETLEQVLKTIYTNLVENGLLIIVYLDGERTLSKLNENGGVFTDGKSYNIKDKGEKTSGGSESKNEYDYFGHQITINLSGSVTVHDDQTEWLVFYPVIEKELAELEFTRVKDSYFDSLNVSSLKGEYDRLPPELKELAKLYRVSVLKKHAVKDTSVTQRTIETHMEQRKNLLPSLSRGEKKELEIEDLPNEEVYRQYTIGDGNCFFNSFLNNYIVGEYSKLTDEGKLELVSSIRNSLAKAMTLDTFKKLNNGELVKVKYFPILKRSIQQHLSDQLSVTELQSLIEKIQDFSPEQAEQEMIKVFKDIDEDDIKILVKNAQIEVYTEFKKELGKCYAWASYEMFEYIMKMLNVNIFILSDITRKPVQTVPCNAYNKDWSSILILSISSKQRSVVVPVHFEPLFVAREISGTPTAVRKFSWNDPVVQYFYNTLCNR